jgi:hypothetical protein
MLSNLAKLTAIALLALLCTRVAAQEKKARKPMFTVGKETTHVLGPLDKAGRIDYETALNEKLRAGVTPDNNANVLLFQAFGPHPNGGTLPEGFFKWLHYSAT